MSSVVIASVALIIGFVLGRIRFSDSDADDKGADKNQTDCYICVQGTTDPTVYRARYLINGREKYSVTGNGITNTLENMIEKIEP